MRMRRALALLCALCFILSSPFSGAFAAEIPTLDDMGIDPWSDLWQIQQTPEPDPDPSPVPIEPAADTLDLAGEEIIPFALGSGSYNFIFETFGTWTIGSSSQRFTYPNRVFSRTANYGAFLSHILPDSQTSFGKYPGGSTPFYLEASAGAYYDITFSVSQVGDKSSIILDGNFVPVLSGGWYEDGKNYTFMQEVSLNAQYMYVILNGNIITDLIPASSNVYSIYSGFVFNNYEIPFDVTSVQTVTFRIYYPSTSKSNSNYFDKTGSYFYNQALKFALFNTVEMQFVDYVAPDKDYTNILERILGWLGSIRDGIVNLVSTVAALPSRIANFIIEGIKSLFIPSEDDLNGLKDKYHALLSERLGFIWQAGEWVTSFASDLLAAITGGAEAEFKFPGVAFDMNGEHYELIAEQAVDFGSNGIVTVIRPFAGTIVALVVVIACVNLFRDMVAAVISGKSYFDFLKGGGAG